MGILLEAVSVESSLQVVNIWVEKAINVTAVKRKVSSPSEVRLYLQLRREGIQDSYSSDEKGS